MKSLISLHFSRAKSTTLPVWFRIGPRTLQSTFAKPACLPNMSGPWAMFRNGRNGAEVAGMLLR